LDEALLTAGDLTAYFFTLIQIYVNLSVAEGSAARRIATD